MPPAWLPDVFKAPAFASAATWFGAFCTLIVFPGAVAGLTAYFIVQEENPSFTIGTTTLVANNFIGGDETGPAYRLESTCRAPAGCFVFFNYQPRGPSEPCAILAESLANQWQWIPYGSPLNPLPLVCYSAIARDGIFVAWQRYPPARQCAVQADSLSSSASAYYRANCTMAFLAQAAVVNNGLSWYPCTNLFSPTLGPGGTPGPNPDLGTLQDQQCYNSDQTWDQYYTIDPKYKAILDPKLECPGDSAVLTCALYPAGLSLKKSSISEISVDTDNVCDLVGATTEDEAAIQYGTHVLQSRKVELKGFDCSFAAPDGWDGGDSVKWKYVASSVQVSTNTGVIPDNVLLPNFEPPSSTTLPRDKGDFGDTVPRFEDLVGAITCAAGKTSVTLDPMCTHNWLPNNIQPLATLYDVPTPATIDDSQALYSRYVKDQVVFARLRASPTYEKETITKKDLVLFGLAVVGSAPRPHHPTPSAAREKPTVSRRLPLHHVRGPAVRNLLLSQSADGGWRATDSAGAPRPSVPRACAPALARKNAAPMRTGRDPRRADRRTKGRGLHRAHVRCDIVAIRQDAWLAACSLRWTHRNLHVGDRLPAVA